MCDADKDMSHEEKLHYYLAGFIKTLSQMNDEAIRAQLAPGQGAVKDLPVSAPSVPPPPRVEDSSFACQCIVWRKGPCPHPESPMAKSQTKYPKDEANPDGPKVNHKFSERCKKEYQKSLTAKKPKVPRKRAASTTATAANSGASLSKKQAPTPVLDAAKEEDDEEAPEQYEEGEEEEQGEEENGLDL